jgi:hypothetical protein
VRFAISLLFSAVILIATTAQAQLKLGQPPQCGALDGVSTALFWRQDQEKFAQALHYFGSYLEAKKGVIPTLIVELQATGRDFFEASKSDVSSREVSGDRACQLIVEIRDELGCQMNNCHAEFRIE